MLSVATVAVIALKSFRSSKIAHSCLNVFQLWLQYRWIVPGTGLAPRLKCQRFESAAVMMYKSLHGMNPEYLSSWFVFRNDITSFWLRNTENKLALSQSRYNYLKKSFSYSIVRLWNSLSSDLRAITSLHDFKLNTRSPFKVALI